MQLANLQTSVFTQGCSGSNFCSGAKPAGASQSQPAGARFCQDYAH
jgi:hypothetical protein